MPKEHVSIKIVEHGARTRIIGIGQLTGTIYATDLFKGGYWNGQFESIGLDDEFSSDQGENRV